MRVWVTRTRPGADATAARLRDLGHEPIVAPVLEVRILPSSVHLADIGALAFTSANAVDAFAAITAEGRTLPAFAVGDATAEAARRAGFDDVRSARGDVHALADLIASEGAAFLGAVLNPTAFEPTADLAALLAERDIDARIVPVYETAPVEPSEALATLASIDAALVHSPRAARRLAGLVDPQTDMLFACISEAAAAPLRAAGHEKVRSAPFPDEASVLKLLEDR
jgi:uroporphyrinogen-III synthase